MREILFRGKHTRTGEWVEGFYYVNRYRYAGGKYFIVEKPKITTGITEASGAYGERVKEIEYEIVPETVGQYTGLTDKNGKKIFEGDIVKHYHDKKFPESYSKGVIYWDEEYLRWKRTSENVKVCIAPDCIYEVIGNIHDNPELLKGGAE